VKRDLFFGALLVLAGHVALALITRVIDGDAAMKIVHRGSMVFIGGVQLTYGLPIAVVTWKRRRGIAIGAAAMMLLTLVVNVIGLLR
jgi:hypothetical protein